MTNNISVYKLKKESKSLLLKLFRTVLVCGVCYLLLFPLFYLVISAIQDPTSMKDPTVVWVPRALSTINFQRAFENLNYGNSMLFTLFLSSVSTILTLLSCSMAGYGFARFNFFEKRITFIFVLLLIIVPPQTTMMSTYLNFRFFDIFGITKLFGTESINLLSSPLTLFFPALFANGIRAGLSIFIFRQFFLGQPKELEEAAKIDGCGIFKTYFRIMIPLSVPAIITVAVFTFVWYWNDSIYGELFFSEGTKTLAVGLSFLRNSLSDSIVSNNSFTAQEQRGILAAASLLCIIPPLVLYVIIQRKFVESIERTGIVG